MAQDRKPLRSRYHDDENVSRLARDVQDQLDLVPEQQIKKSTGIYSAKMLIGLSKQPVAIELIRLISNAAPETLVSHGTAVQWVWRPQLGGAQVLGIDGLSTGTTVYQFTFRITY